MQSLHQVHVTTFVDILGRSVYGISLFYVPCMLINNARDADSVIPTGWNGKAKTTGVNVRDVTSGEEMNTSLTPIPRKKIVSQFHLSPAFVGWKPEVIFDSK